MQGETGSGSPGASSPCPGVQGANLQVCWRALTRRNPQVTISAVRWEALEGAEVGQGHVPH